MYTKLSKLNQDKIEFLEMLSKQVTYRNNNIRMGANGPEKASVYLYSKWFDWDRNQRKAYKSCFDPALSGNAIMGWFLKFPKDTGFLDLMTYWVNHQLSGTVVSFALSNQEILLNGEKVPVLSGEGIKFSLKIPHEIKSSNTETTWACLMLLK